MNASDLSSIEELPVYFTTNGKDIWELKSYCMSPTVRMVNLKDQTEASFGMNGINAETFHKIKMPIKAENKG